MSRVSITASADWWYVGSTQLLAHTDASSHTFESLDARLQIPATAKVSQKAPVQIQPIEKPTWVVPMSFQILFSH